MNRNYWLQNHSETRWKTSAAEFTKASANTQSWLEHKDSLTARLKENCTDFRVQVLSESLSMPDSHEASLIAEQNPVWVREVYLYGDKQPWVYARSAMPADNSSNQLTEVKQLHQKPLGEMLFSHPELQICERMIAEFKPESTLNPGNSTCIESLWGRRTLFKVGQYPLVVTEIFLPKAPAYR